MAEITKRGIGENNEEERGVKEGKIKEHNNFFVVSSIYERNIVLSMVATGFKQAAIYDISKLRKC